MLALLVAVSLSLALVAVLLPGSNKAFANAANPNPTTTGTMTQNSDGTVSVAISGTWSWAGQNCEGRYGEGFSVDWWGISTSATPSPSFSLTNASEVTGFGTTTTGTISPSGSDSYKEGTGPGATTEYFHVAPDYSGETVNSASTCTDTGSGPSASASGAWSAAATYPSTSDVPSQLCVNIYDEHGSEGSASNNANDISPVNNNDNSIQTNSFDPTSSSGYCLAKSSFTQQWTTFT
ncbi:MAG: hypothetical protein ACRD6W_00480 [Nitrososphaerales archaeon]